MSYRVVALIGLVALVVWNARISADPQPFVKAQGGQKEDPWVGTYSAYELSYARSPDGQYSPSKRHGGKITIARKGDYYTVDFAPEVKLRRVNERLLSAGDNSGNPRLVELRVEGGQRVLQVMSSFHSLYLVQGEVPKTWKLAPK